MAYGGFLGAGSHAQRSEEAVHQNGELVDVLRLCFHHVKHNLVPLPHALCVRRTNIVLDNDFPLPATQPAAHETLNLQTEMLTNVKLLKVPVDMENKK